MPHPGSMVISFEPIKYFQKIALEYQYLTYQDWTLFEIDLDNFCIYIQMFQTDVHIISFLPFQSIYCWSPP